MEQMFEVASREKLRFGTVSGNIGAEDLWDMPLTSRRCGASLDDLAKDLNRQVKADGEESFVVKKSAKNSTLELAFEIVKHVIKVKMAEADASEKAAENKAKKEQILSIIADKQSDELKGKSIKDLTKLVGELQ